MSNTNTIYLRNIAEQVDTTVALRGWVYNKRSSGKIAFLQFRDGSGYIQAVVVKQEVSDQTWDAVQNVTLESSVHMEGLVKKDDRSPSGFELQLSKLTIIGLAPDDYPIGKKEHGPGFLLDNRHFWLRSPKQRAIQVIRNQVMQAMHGFFAQDGFVEVDTPIFTPTACEGTTELFEVDYFGEPAYLSQSGQLYLEALLPSLGKVYDMQPVFRAEKSKTRRHLTEFWMSNAEAAFVEHDENLEIQERLIQHVFVNVLACCEAELSVLERDTALLSKIAEPFERMTHKEAVALLQSLGSTITSGDDLGAEDETLLGEHVGKPVFIEYYPADVKAFYMKRLPSDETRVLCADLIAPEGNGEVIGGSQREDDYETLLSSIRLHKLPEEEFAWYLDQRRYGSVPHSGFGVGIERLVKWICGIHHVRETIAFPRMINRLRP